MRSYLDHRRKCKKNQKIYKKNLKLMSKNLLDIKRKCKINQ